MAKGVTFPDKETAKEYERVMRAKGWETLLQESSTTPPTYIVLVSEYKGGEKQKLENIPETTIEAFLAEEQEMGVGQTYPKRRLARGSKETAKDIRDALDKDTMRTLKGETIKPILEHTSKRMDVVGGMKRAIPRAAPTEEVPRVGRMGAAHIATAPGKAESGIAITPSSRLRASGSMPPIATTGLGLSGVSRFQTAPYGMRFQAPRMRRLRLGNKLLPESDEDIERSNE